MTTYICIRQHTNEDEKYYLALFSDSQVELHQFAKAIDIPESRFDNDNYFGCYYINDFEADQAQQYGAKMLFNPGRVEYILAEKAARRARIGHEIMVGMMSDLQETGEISQEVLNEFEEYKRIFGDKTKSKPQTN